MALRVPCGVLAAAPQRAAVPSARPRLPAARLSRGLSRLQVAVTDDSGYESSADDNVMSGKVKAVSRMTLLELKAELTEASLETTGSRPELITRLRTARKASKDSAQAAQAASAAQVNSAEPVAVESVAAEAKEEVKEEVKAKPRPKGKGLPLELKVTCKLCFGESLMAVGSHAGLGAWDCAAAVPLTWSEGECWTGTATVPAEGFVELKFCIRRANGTLVWQAGDNIKVHLTPNERQLPFSGSYPPGLGRPGALNVNAI